MGVEKSDGYMSDKISALERRKTALENHSDTWELLVRRDFLDSKRKDCEHLKASLTHYGFSQWELHAVLIGAFIAQCGISILQGHGLAIVITLVTSLLLLQLRIYRDKYTLYTCTGSCGLYVALFSVSHLGVVAGGGHLDCLVLLALLILALIHLVVFIVASKYSHGNFEGFYDTNIQISIPDARQLHGIVLGVIVGIATVFAIVRIYSLAYCGFVVVIFSSFARLKFSGAIHCSGNPLPPQRCFPVVRNLLSIIFTGAAIAASITSLFDGNIVTLKNQQTFVKWLQGVAESSVVIKRMETFVAVFVLVLMLVFLLDLAFLISMLCKSSNTLKSLLHCRLVILGRLCFAKNAEDVAYCYKLYTLDHAGRLKRVHTLKRQKRPVSVCLNLCDVYYRLLNVSAGGCNGSCSGEGGGVLMSTSRLQALRGGGDIGAAGAPYAAFMTFRESGGALGVQGAALDTNSNLPSAPKATSRHLDYHNCPRPLYCRLEPRRAPLKTCLENNPLVKFNTLLRQWIVQVDFKVASEAKARESRLRQQYLEWLQQQQQKVWRPCFGSKSLPLNYYESCGVGSDLWESGGALDEARIQGQPSRGARVQSRALDDSIASSKLGSSTNSVGPSRGMSRSMSIPTNPRTSLTKVLEIPKVLEVSQRLYRQRCKTANVSDSFMNQRAGIIDRVRGSWLTRGDVDYNSWPSFGVDINSYPDGNFDLSKNDFNFEAIDKTLEGIFSNLEICRDNANGTSGAYVGGNVAIDLSSLQTQRVRSQPFTILGESGGASDGKWVQGGAPTKAEESGGASDVKGVQGGALDGCNTHMDSKLHWLDATLESLLTNHLAINRKPFDTCQTLSPQQHSHLPQPTTILIPPDLNSAENSPTSVSVSVAESAPKVQKLESRRFHGVATVENLTRYYEHYKAASAAASAASTPISKQVDRLGVSGDDLEASQVTDHTLSPLTKLQEAPPTLVPIYDFDEDARNSFNQVGVNKQRLLQCMKQLPLALQNSRDSSVCEQKSQQLPQPRDWRHFQHWNEYQDSLQEFEMHQQKRSSGAKVIACAGEMSDEPMASSGGFASGNRARGASSSSSSSSATATATATASVNEPESWKNYNEEDFEETAKESDLPFTPLGVQGRALDPSRKSGGAKRDEYSQEDIYTLTDNVPLGAGDASIRAMVTQMLDDTPSATESIMRELVEHLDIPDTASEDSFEYIYNEKHENRRDNL